MLNRFARIYPVYFLIITLSFIIYTYTGDFEHTTLKNGTLYYLGSVFFVRGFFADFYNYFVAQSWSLTVEECFYILCPVFFLLIKKNIRAIIWIPLLLIGTGCLIVYMGKGNMPYGFFKDYRFLFNFTFLGRCIEFFAGIALGLWYKKTQPAVVKRSSYTVAGIVIIALCVWGLSLLHTGTQYGDYFTGGIILNNVVLPLTGIAVLYWGLLTEKNIITKLLSSKIFSLLGKSSYVFYLIHIGIFAELFYFHVSKNPILYFVYLNMVAIILYKFFEHPLNKIIKVKFSIKPDNDDIIA